MKIVLPLEERFDMKAKSITAPSQSVSKQSAKIVSEYDVAIIVEDFSDLECLVCCYFTPQFRFFIKKLFVDCEDVWKRKGMLGNL